MRIVIATLLLTTSAFAGPVIVLDPGHGGTQDGAVSPAGVLEKNLALTISKVVKAQL